MKKVEGCFCGYGVNEHMGKVMGGDTATGTGKRASGGGGGRREGYRRSTMAVRCRTGW